MAWFAGKHMVFTNLLIVYVTTIVFAMMFPKAYEV